VVGVLGVLDDKDAASMLRRLLREARPRWCSPTAAIPRSLSPGTLESLASKLGGPPSETVADPRRALTPSARAGRIRRPPVLVTGSIYLIADPRARRARRPRLHAMNDGEFPSLLVVVGIVAIVVAIVILVFFGIGYLIGRLVL